MTGKHGKGSDYTAAQRLPNNFEITENCSHIYLFESYDKAMDKVRVTTTRERKRNKNKPCHETTEDFADLTKETKNQVKHVVKGLDLEDGKFLLAVGWAKKNLN